MKKLNNSGFTLVELLAVIVVLALLMVVAASSIGSSLNNAKASSMETEAKKVVAKTYEDLKMKEVNSSFAYTYTGIDTATGATDGEYKIWLGINNGKIESFCIQESATKETITYGTVSDATIDIPSGQGYVDGKCVLNSTTTDGVTTNTATKYVSGS